MKRILCSLIISVVTIIPSLYAGNRTNLEEIPKAVSIQELAQPIICEEIVEQTEEQIKEIIPTIEEIKENEFISKHNEIKKIENKKEYFIAYKDLIFEYINWIDPPETVFDVFTEDEVRLICKAVETECYQKNFDSKANVASVIFNRIESGEFGDTITEIITNPNQFAYGRDNITEDTILAVMYAFEIEDTTDGCIAFRSGSKPEKWYTWGDNYWSRIFIDDAGHGFYK